MELLSNKEKLHGIIANVELHGMNVKDELHDAAWNYCPS